MKLLYSVVLVFFIINVLQAQDEEKDNSNISTFTDSRDGTTYKAIEFSIPLEGGVFVKRTWMAENLKYEIGQGSYCYKDEPAYCTKFGKLYTYLKAVDACPEGWRVPTTNDWMLLFSAYGGLHSAGTALMEGGESGMDLLLGGFGDASGLYKGISIEGNYWDSEEMGGNTAGVITFHKGSTEVFHSKIGKNHRSMTRCIKEY